MERAQGRGQQWIGGVVRRLVELEHIALVDDGEDALVRELEAPLSRLLERAGFGELARHGSGPMSAQELVSELVVQLGELLMSSDLVEEVFADDRVIRRDSTPLVQEALARLALESPEPPRPLLSVRIDRVRHLEVFPGRLDDSSALRAALVRAGDTGKADFRDYDAATRTATFEIWVDVMADPGTLEDSVAQALAESRFGELTMFNESAAGEPDLERFRGSKVVQFVDFNFKLLVVQALMYESNVLRPRFDVASFLASRGQSLDGVGGSVVPEARDYFQNLEIRSAMLEEITSLVQDSHICCQIFPFWDGEDRRFSICSAEDATLLPNLKKLTLFDTDGAVLEALRKLGIDTHLV